MVKRLQVRVSRVAVVVFVEQLGPFVCLWCNANICICVVDCCSAMARGTIGLIDLHVCESYYAETVLSRVIGQLQRQGVDLLPD